MEKDESLEIHIAKKKVNIAHVIQYCCFENYLAFPYELTRPSPLDTQHVYTRRFFKNVRSISVRTHSELQVPSAQLGLLWYGPFRFHTTPKRTELLLQAVMMTVRYLLGDKQGLGGTLRMLCCSYEASCVFLSHGSVWKSERHVWLLQPHRLCPWNSPGQNTGVGGLSLLQGIFPTQGSNPGLSHCRRKPISPAGIL